MAGRQNLEVEEVSGLSEEGLSGVAKRAAAQEKLEAAKAQLLASAQELTLKQYLGKHPIVTLAGAFFAGVILGGSLEAQSRVVDLTVNSIKEEVLRQIFDR